MNKVVFIDGCRTPFLKAGTDYQDLLSYQLAQFAIKGLIDKTQISNLKIDRVILGNVIANIKTSNVSREAALMAGVDYKTPCNTVVQACISANRAICDAYFEIASGKGDIIIAGGVDSCSDTPIGYKKSMQKKLFNAQKIKGFWATIRFIFSFKISDFFPERPQIAEYISGRDPN